MVRIKVTLKMIALHSFQYKWGKDDAPKGEEGLASISCSMHPGIMCNVTYYETTVDTTTYRESLKKKIFLCENLEVQ